MRSILDFAIYVLENWKLASTPPKWQAFPNPMHPLYCALPVPQVPVWVTRGAVIAHQDTYTPPRCRILQYSRSLIPLLVSLWNDLSDPVIDGV